MARRADYDNRVELGRDSANHPFGVFYEIRQKSKNERSLPRQKRTIAYHFIAFAPQQHVREIYVLL